MAKHERISEERKKLIQEFINQNNITTAKDIEEALKNMFKDTLLEMLEAEMTTQLGYNLQYIIIYLSILQILRYFIFSYLHMIH